MLHTIQEAVRLVGRTRMTLYRHMDSGRLSYTLDHDKRRRIETAELIRVYGPLKPQEKIVTPKRKKPADTHTDLLKMLVEEVRALRAENGKQAEQLAAIKDENHKQAEQLAAIRKELAERPRLEQTPAAPTPPPAKAEPEPQPEQPHGRHAFSSIMDRIRQGQAEPQPAESTDSADPNQ